MMSAQVRAEARASGWPDHVARGLHVAYADGGFQVNSHDSHYAAAQDLEYGTPGTQPTAAIRRYSNRTGEAQKFLLKRTMHHLGGSK